MNATKLGQFVRLSMILVIFAWVLGLVLSSPSQMPIASADDRGVATPTTTRTPTPTRTWTPFAPRGAGFPRVYEAPIDCWVLDELGVAWYYDWSKENQWGCSSQTHVFVPMQWGLANGTITGIAAPDTEWLPETKLGDVLHKNPWR